MKVDTSDHTIPKPEIKFKPLPMPKEIPPKPHPRMNFSPPELPEDGDHPLIKELWESLEDTYRDIELNYKRLNFRNRSTKLMLLMIMDILGYCMKMLPYEEQEYQQELEEEERENATFSTSKEGIS